MRYGLAKYNTFKYGSGPTIDNLLWGIEVDWDGDGYFTGENEAPYAVNLRSKRGRDNIVNSSLTGFETMKIGEASITLDNSTGRYDPYNTSSPLYGLFYPGRKIRITVKKGTAGNKYNVFYGILSDIRVYGYNQTAEMRISDLWQSLADVEGYSPVIKNIKANGAILQLLANSNFSIPTYLEDTVTYMHYWWEGSDKLKSQIDALASSALGDVFIDAAGTLRLYNRNHSETPIVITQSEILKDIRRTMPWDEQIGKLQIYVNPYEEQTSQEIWKLDDVVPILSGETLSFVCQYQDPSIDVQTPIAGIDVAGVDGGGNPINLIVVSFFDRGEYAILNIKNNSAVDGIINLMRIIGVPIVPSHKIGFEKTINNPDPKYMIFDNRRLQSVPAAQEYMNIMSSFFENNPHIVTIIIEGRPDLQFGLELMNHVQLVANKIGINNAYRVIDIEHEWVSKNGTIVRTTVKLEPPKVAGSGLETDYIVPAGAEIFWYGNAADIPADFEIDQAFKACYVRAASSPSDVLAGTDKHKHTVPNTSLGGEHSQPFTSGNTGSATGTTVQLKSAGSPYSSDDFAHISHVHPIAAGSTNASPTHDHPIADTDEAVNLPPYVAMYLIRAKIDTVCPIYGIVMTGNASTNIPAGFTVCNGSLDTPDMRDRFVYGASVDADVGDKAGNTDHEHNNGAVGSGGAHNHTKTGNTGISNYPANDITQGTGTTAASENHVHPYSFTTNTEPDHVHSLGKTNTTTVVPSYVKLYYMMRIV